jgi:hypothetical protein
VLTGYVVNFAPAVRHTERVSATPLDEANKALHASGVLHVVGAPIGS